MGESLAGRDWERESRENGDGGKCEEVLQGNGSALARFLCSCELNEMSLSNLLLSEACNMPVAACDTHRETERGEYSASER